MPFSHFYRNMIDMADSDLVIIVNIFLQLLKFGTGKTFTGSKSNKAESRERIKREDSCMQQYRGD